MIDIQKRIINIESKIAYNWRLDLLLYDNVDTFKDKLLNDEDKLLDTWRSTFPNSVIKKTAIELLEMLLTKALSAPFKCLCGLPIRMNLDGLINNAERELLSEIIYNDDKHPIYDEIKVYFFKPGLNGIRIKYVDDLLTEYRIIDKH